MRTPTEVAPDAAAFAVLYTQVQQFYAHQMQLFDGGAAQQWARTFTEDAVFDVPASAGPVHGRAALAASLDAAAARAARTGVRYRHVMGMPDVAQRPDGGWDVRSYTIVHASTIGGVSRVHRVCVCEDVLVCGADGRLLVSHRRVTRDDLP
ncbi:nuclear transport factor 2 family protein [Streptomyces sp. NPDC050264]|uniref:nuclear transport factor 2 family protein n=1 Tax=Streptomyces sp. NPDC050264 TaxID=3155038 RepID=UPI003426C9A1